jgi:phosphohistidine phosphatase
VKKIYLVRHAEAVQDNSTFLDKDRMLSISGIQDCKKLSNYLSVKNIFPDIIYCSSARRCIDTLELIFQDRDINLDNKIVKIENNLYGADLPFLLNLISYTSDLTHSLMIVNHEPVLTQLTNQLIRNSKEDDKNKPLDKFSTCGMAILEHESENWERINSYDMRLINFVKPNNLATSIL